MQEMAPASILGDWLAGIWGAERRIIGPKGVN